MQYVLYCIYVRSEMYFLKKTVNSQHCTGYPGRVVLL